ncbi:hypothetical protein ILUMI_03827 [Ignelater luminosus]|uniref:adenosine deaminase n=1 Tax=Ignelater luminosus TaxID=2038154 RepID=A0A8K0DA25_IGNLU|nr:hypothetical protein ILUMI_03827 [Ignelater luminosus]
MLSFACVVLLLLVVINVLQANTNTSSSNNERKAYPSTILTASVKKNEKRKLALEFQTELERRSKLSRDVRTVEEFWQERNKIANLEVKQLLGNSLLLDESEVEANKIILSKKYEEYNKALDPNEIFPPSRPFMEVKEMIEQSDIFKIIKKLPKGASIYCTVLTIVGFEFYYQLTFEDNLYFLFDDKLYFKYSRSKPSPKWKLLSHIRETDDNPQFIEDLNNEIKASLGIVSIKTWPTDPVLSQDKLSDFVRLRLSLMKYKPNFIRCIRNALENLYEDNVMYAEINLEFPELYDLDGNTYDPVSVLRLCKTILDDFKKTHKDFLGVRFYYVSETYTVKDVGEYRKVANDLWKANPNLIAGVGIIADKEALSDYVEELLKFPKEINIFIYTGFTNNWGIDLDYNILNALVLSVDSIEEAFAMNKHPFIVEELRKNNIPIKISPIQSQILNYVKDLRSHPASILIATNYPVVIGSIGSTIANATGLSENWYEAYMAITPRFCDIRCLKQFAINSWLYCTLPVEEKKKAISAWEDKWDAFIEDVIIDWATKKS